VAKSKGKSTSRSSQFGPQIEAESQLRYQPQYDALAALLKQAVSDRDQGIRVQDTVRRGLVQSAQQATPQAGAALQSALGTIDSALQGVPLQGLAGQDVAATKARLADQMARTATELAQRQNDAAAGYAGGVRQVGAQYESDKGKIADQLSSLAGQQGTFGASRLAELLGEDKKMRHDTNQQTRQQKFTAGENTKNRSQTERDSLRSSGIDPDTGKPIPGGKLDPNAKDKKPKWATPQQQGAFEDSVAAAIAQAQKLQATRSRSEAAKILRDGRPGQTVVDPASGQSVNVPGIKAYGDLVASIALDAVYPTADGSEPHISARNVERAHRRRYKVSGLGIPTKVAPGQKIPAPPAPQFPASISPFTPLGG
jgi:hypothetical protein